MGFLAFLAFLIALILLIVPAHLSWVIWLVVIGGLLLSVSGGGHGLPFTIHRK